VRVCVCCVLLVCVSVVACVSSDSALNVVLMYSVRGATLGSVLGK